MAYRRKRLPTPAERLTATVTALGAALLPITVFGGDAHDLLPLLAGQASASPAPPRTDPSHVGAGGQLPTDPPPASVAAVANPAVPANPTGPFASVPNGQLGIPQIVLNAYLHAAQVMADTNPQCGLQWPILAGIGRIESNHADGGNVDSAGTTRTPILGPELNGSAGVAAIPDTDNGAYDHDVVWDRAVGPMQFIPSTWRHYTPSANANPNNVNDAALATADFLCSAGTNLRDPIQLAAAIYRYNPSYDYVRAVLEWANRYASGVIPLPPGFPTTDVAPPALSETVPPVGALPPEDLPVPPVLLPPPPPPPPGSAAPPPPPPPPGSDPGSGPGPGPSSGPGPTELAPPPPSETVQPPPPPPPSSTQDPPPPPPPTSTQDPPPPPPPSSTQDPPPPPPPTSTQDPPASTAGTDPTSTSAPTTTPPPGAS